MNKFPMGRLSATPSAMDELDKAGEIPDSFLYRHGACDWGDVCAEDWALNDAALIAGSRILSAYTLSSGCRIWIITEWDRSATTILLPEDY